MYRALTCLRACFSIASPLLILLLLAPASALAKPAKPAVPPAPPLLPQSFAGWQIAGRAQTGTSPTQADPANPDVLAEYGFQQFEAAHYTEPGNTLSVRAIRFHDASGAYGAFTFYRTPNSIAEDIGRGAAWNGSHVLFWAESTLVDAEFGHLTAMSAAELRELAGDLPQPPSNDRIAPSLPKYLPLKGLVKNQTHYTLGPAAYARSGGVLPPDLIDFKSGSAEAITATYKERDGQGELTLLNYPTPQLAEAREQILTRFLKAGNNQGAWPRLLADSPSGTILVRRSGPLVAVLSGTLPSSTAHRIIGQVNYEAGVVWDNPNGYVGEGAKIAHLLIGIVILTAIIGGAAILLGLFLGGGRAAYRVLRGRPASSVTDKDDFIRLNLDD